MLDVITTSEMLYACMLTLLRMAWDAFYMSSIYSFIQDSINNFPFSSQQLTQHICLAMPRFMLKKCDEDPMVIIN